MAYSINAKDYFNTTLYVGNGSSKTITGIPFAPSFVWIKNRSEAENHVIVDTVRGANNYLMPNTTATNDTNSEFLKSFTSDGYTLGLGDRVNKSSNNLVSWNWKANGQGSSNTDGSINTTYTSANTTSGCSIVTYTGNGTSGATIGHGLGVAPAVVLVKRLNATSDWVMYHKGMGASQFIVLNTDAAPASSAGIFYNTAPTSDIFYVGSDGATNASGGTYVAYCFADVQGFSKSSSYIGDGNSRFIYTGFKPAFVLGKQLAGGSDWWLFDSARNPSNIANKLVYPNANAPDATNAVLDLLSNGFKMKTSAAQFNGNGTTYLYMAFAEEPLVSTNGVPATAR
jgi:hypothetical protein